MTSVYDVTAAFEAELCRYTGAPYAVAVDSCSHALFLSLVYQRRNWLKYRYVYIPECTYVSVPCEIRHAGAIPKFLQVTGSTLTGAYQLYPYNVWDSALWFSAGMFNEIFTKGYGGNLPKMVCLSFTGPHKTLSLGKAGAILTDSADAAEWLKRARYSGRREMPYHLDTLDFEDVGWNYYLLPEIAANGLRTMARFYRPDGTPVKNEPLTRPYPKLNNHPLWRGQ